MCGFKVKNETTNPRYSKSQLVKIKLDRTFYASLIKTKVWENIRDFNVWSNYFFDYQKKSHIIDGNLNSHSCFYYILSTAFSHNL